MLAAQSEVAGELLTGRLPLLLAIMTGLLPWLLQGWFGQDFV